MSNLLPTSQKFSIVRLYRKRFLSVIFFSVLFLAVVGIILLLPSFFLLKSNEIVLSAKRDTLAGYETSKIAQSLAATVRDINTRLGAFADKGTPSMLVGGLIDPVLKAKSDAIHLTAFSYEPSAKNTDRVTEAKVKISGTADSRDDLLAFSSKLRAIGNFKNVVVPITSFIKDSNVTFTASATVTLAQ